MAAFTSKATGNWSASGQTTWNESGVPTDGDTVSIAAHTITVDANTTVGTSPNDATTKVINITSASGKLIVATGVTLTIKGNCGGVNGSTYQQNAGSTVVFDASGSGGTPVYTFINAGFMIHIFNGSSGSRCSIRSVNSSYTFSLCPNWNGFTASYTDFLRCSSPGSATAGGGNNLSITNCTYTSCGNLDITCNLTGANVTIADTVFSSSTHATDSIKLTTSAAATTGVRSISRCVLDKFLNVAAYRTMLLKDSFLGGIVCNLSAVTMFNSPPTNVFIKTDGTANGGNGMAISGSWERLYLAVERTAGNPHFLSPYAKNGVDETYKQIVFESQSPDLVDVGDCFIMNASTTTGGNKVVAKNYLVLKSGYSGSTVSSGTALTIFSNTTSAALFESYRGTINVDNSTLVGSIGIRGAFAIAEGTTGLAGQVPNLKSNLVWGSSSSQGFLGERVSGNIKDIITTSDYNWRYNSSDGDNGRGYEDRAASNTLWTAGNASAASIDTHQGSGDPGFVDSTRNVTVWSTARGYGSTYAAGIAALQADPLRISDLITYVQDGFRVTNASMRTAAHDGGAAGAMNYHKSTRTTTPIFQLSGLVPIPSGRPGTQSGGNLSNVGILTGSAM